MTIKQALRQAIETLTSNRFEEAHLEAELLLRHLLGIGRAELHLRLEDSLPPEQTPELDRLIRRRLSHEPMAYITGHKEFFGLDLIVTADTLIPRPETELLVEKALELAGNRTSPTIADVGTGCGAIAIAMAVHLPQAKVYAFDISTAALEVAALNCERHRVTERVHLLQGDLLQGDLASNIPARIKAGDKPPRYDLILANLPYVSDRQMRGLCDDVRLFEPALALSGGPDGLQQISRLLAQARDKLHPGGAILLEISPEQRTGVVELAGRHLPGDNVKVYPDLSGHDRVIVMESKADKNLAIAPGEGA
ncbi:MAG: Release factor glutamine methyltransferase [Dehalococcoidia bacterium]|nr:Release factor glutamine methyltransferase [Chloroflexota bacterium]MBT9162399.1 Release factor glutamine methyltransferase [Chloroflexota bacterium]